MNHRLTPGTASMWIARLGEILTRDYCPQYDAYVKWIRNPPAVLGLAIVASTLCGLYLHPQGFVLAIALAAVLALGVVWPWLIVWGLSGTLSFEKGRAREGEPVAARLSVRNRSPWGAWGLVVRGGGRSLPGAGMAHAGGWRTTEARWDFVADRRGDYPIGPARIATGFPFGLGSASRRLAVPTRLLVWPRTFPVGAIPEVAGGHHSEGLAPRDRAGTSGDFLGVRPYRRGDSLRRIHWPQTARHGQLVVCERQATAVPRVQVVLDAHPAEHAGEGPDGSLEWAIRIAASFLEGWIGQGAEMELVCDGRVVSARTGSVPARRARVLDALARLEPEGLLSLADLLDLPAVRQFDGGLRIVIATDLGLRHVVGRPSRAGRERFVVLDASAFAPGEPAADPSSLPVAPWIRIDGPAGVPQGLRRNWKEVLLGC